MECLLLKAITPVYLGAEQSRAEMWECGSQERREPGHCSALIPALPCLIPNRHQHSQGWGEFGTSGTSVTIYVCHEEGKYGENFVIYSEKPQQVTTKPFLGTQG